MPFDLDRNSVFGHTIDVLVRDGWCQRTPHDLKGRHCLVGALEVALRDVPQCRDLQERAIMALQDTVGFVSLTAWNDDPDRTLEDVIALLQKAKENAYAV